MRQVCPLKILVDREHHGENEYVSGQWSMDNDVRSLSIRRSNGEASVGASVTKKEEKEDFSLVNIFCK